MDCQASRAKLCHLGAVQVGIETQCEQQGIIRMMLYRLVVVLYHHSDAFIHDTLL